MQLRMRHSGNQGFLPQDEDKRKDDTMKSWKTTAVGIGALLVAIGSAMIALLDDDPNTSLNIQQLISALAGLGLIAARDNSKTSEDVGAKPAENTDDNG